MIGIWSFVIGAVCEMSVRCHIADEIAGGEDWKKEMKLISSNNERAWSSKLL